MATALVALATTTLASASATVTFSSISGAYRDLRLVITGSTSNNSDIQMRFNGDSGANYSFVYMGGNGSSAASGSNTGQPGVVLDAYFWRSTDQSMIVADIMDYTATDKHKTVLSRNNVTAGGTDAFANRWANTAAITSITLVSTWNWNVGSTFSLFGVSA